MLSVTEFDEHAMPEAIPVSPAVPEPVSTDGQDAIGPIERALAKARFWVRLSFSLGIAAFVTALYLIFSDVLTRHVTALPTPDSFFEMDGRTPHKIGLVLLGASLVSWAWSCWFVQVLRLHEGAKREAKAKVDADKALASIAGPTDIKGLMIANTKRMSLYDQMARNQAEGSYRASLLAMGAGLIIVAVGLATTVLAVDTAAKYTAAIVAAVGTAAGGYIARTFIAVYRDAQEQSRYYFHQPLVQSYLLTAERLSGQMPECEQYSQCALIIGAALTQAAQVHSRAVGTTTKQPAETTPSRSLNTNG